MRTARLLRAKGQVEYKAVLGMRKALILTGG